MAAQVCVVNITKAAGLCSLGEFTTGLARRLAQVFFQLARLMPAASVWIVPTHSNHISSFEFWIVSTTPVIRVAAMIEVGFAFRSLLATASEP